jgi:hypothetical protein
MSAKSEIEGREMETLAPAERNGRKRSRRADRYIFHQVPDCRTTPHAP